MDPPKVDARQGPLFDAAGLHLPTTHSEQETLRVLEQVRGRRSTSADPGAELGVVKSMVGQKLRLLTREVGKPGGPTTEEIEKWRRRLYIEGSVAIKTTQYSTSTGKAYQITAVCQSMASDKDCPNFPPFEDDYLPENLTEGRRAAEAHRDKWVLAVLSALDVELGIALAEAGWIEDEYGHQDTKEREADRDVRTHRV